MTHPLDLPEILLHVASFLDNKDRESCLLVCKAWHQTIVPLIWEKFSLWTYRRETWPSIDTIDRHAHHISTLAYCSNLPHEYFFFPGLRQVRSLSLSFDGLPAGILDSTYWDAVTVIIRQNRGLEILNLNDTWPAINAAEGFWDAVASHSGIRTISVHGGKNMNSPPNGIDRPDHGLWRICRSQLEKLYLTSIFLPANPDALPLGQDMDTTFPRMKKLDLSAVTDANEAENHDASILIGQYAASPNLGQVRALARCPNLQDLRMYFSYTRDCPRDAIVQRFVAGFWPLLARVALIIAGFTDEQLAQIAGSLGAVPVEEFLVPESLFGYQTLAAFEKQNLFESMRKLNIHDLRVLEWAAPESSVVVQTILERCPVLEVFFANYLLASHVAHGQEWAATRMKKLKVDIIIDNDNDNDNKEEMIAEGKKEKKKNKQSREELHVAVFERLGKLHQLDTLILNSRPLTNAVELERRMRLDLRHGLGLLENVGRLEVLSFSNQQVFEEEEVDWIKEHWKKLRHISPFMHPDPERIREISLAMSLAGVDVY
ncbi:hypothetical protein BG015_001065 [Linnemannia schmuckeri]|uniref:F-box domain-containing protein n=1 Tax=Linnemannia schmuckeri TaxID=64567 RepID=A0A9P5V778_9FUNG|nr:hypothetical protein BG015_001065 [Linnemannia schmuckeri]